MRRAAGETRERLLQAGAELMAEKGFGGVSVRAICKRADTSINMVHHFFGNKQGLLDAIVATYGEQTLSAPMQLLDLPATSREDFASRIHLLFAAILRAYVQHRALMMVVIREQLEPAALSVHTARMTEFIEQAKRDGLVRAQLDTAMVTGLMLDRLINQVQFAPWLKRSHGIDVQDEAYQRRWCKANVDLLLHGMVAPEQQS